MGSENNIHGIGILKTSTAKEKYSLKRYLPSDELKPFIQRYWIVHWDLTGEPPYEQHMIPHPCINLVFEKGKTKIWGISKGKSTRLIEGKGTVFGIKFRPGGFYPFWKRPVALLTGRSIEVKDVFSDALMELEEPLVSEAADEVKIKLAETFFMKNIPPCSKELSLIYAVVNRMMNDREITTVEQVARLFNISLRKLQRLFRQYVGVSPKWVIRRYRLHEAAEQMENGQAVDGSQLALELGYYDQAHFIRDFKSIIGVPPETYARRLND